MASKTKSTCLTFASRLLQAKRKPDPEPTRIYKPSPNRYLGDGPIRRRLDLVKC